MKETIKEELKQWIRRGCEECPHNDCMGEFWECEENFCFDTIIKEREAKQELFAILENIYITQAIPSKYKMHEIIRKYK